MDLHLQLREPLSQVVFVHDYLQLVFQEHALTVYNLAMYMSKDLSIKQGEPGFCDAVVALIEQTAQVHANPGEPLVLRFLCGASITVPCSGPDTRGPEAWQFGELSGPYIVEQNV